MRCRRATHTEVVTDTTLVATVIGGVIGAASGTLGAWLTARATRKAADASRQAAVDVATTQAAASLDSQFKQWQQDARTTAYTGVVGSFRVLMTSWWALRDARREDAAIRAQLHQQVTTAHATFNSDLGRAQLLSTASVLASITDLSLKVQDFDAIAEDMRSARGQESSKEEYERARLAAEAASKAFVAAARAELTRTQSLVAA